MFKIRNHKQFQTILVITTILFMLSIYLTQYIINEKIYKINFFNNVSEVVDEKEFLIKNVYYDGKYLSNSIVKSTDIINKLKYKSELSYKNSVLDSFFNSQHTLSNISIYDKNLNLIMSKYKKTILLI